MLRKEVVSDKSTTLSRRRSTRVRAHGILTLTGLGRPIVAVLHDIGLGGVSFLYSGRVKGLRSKNEIHMEILIFYGATEPEYYIRHIKGRFISRSRTTDLQSHSQLIRFNVEFLELDSRNRDILKACSNQLIM